MTDKAPSMVLMTWMPMQLSLGVKTQSSRELTTNQSSVVSKRTDVNRRLAWISQFPIHRCNYEPSLWMHHNGSQEWHTKCQCLCTVKLGVLLTWHVWQEKYLRSNYGKHTQIFSKDKMENTITSLFCVYVWSDPTKSYINIRSANSNKPCMPCTAEYKIHTCNSLTAFFF